MATQYLSDKVDENGTLSPKYASVGLIHEQATVTFAATNAADIVPVIVLPAGMKVVDVIERTAALGASTTLTLGTTDDADLLIKSHSTAAAALTRMNNEVANPFVTEDTTIYATVGGAAATGVVIYDFILAHK